MARCTCVSKSPGMTSLFRASHTRSRRKVVLFANENLRDSVASNEDLGVRHGPAGLDVNQGGVADQEAGGWDFLCEDGCRIQVQRVLIGVVEPDAVREVTRERPPRIAMAIRKRLRMGQFLTMCRQRLPSEAGALLGLLFETKEANRVAIENVSLLLLRQEGRLLDRFNPVPDLLRPAHLI
jgi:hypothetical protein